MERKKVLLQMMSLGLVLLFVTACSTPRPVAPPPPTATSVPSTTPEPPTVTPEPPVWDYVALGDSVVGQIGDYAYINHYTAYLEADLGIKVMLHPHGVGGYRSIQLLDRIRDDQALRDELREAEVVTVFVGGNDVAYKLLYEYKVRTCGGDDNMNCIREAYKDIKANYDAILDELLALCVPHTIIRVATMFYDDLSSYGFDGDTTPFYDPLNEQIIQSAAEHNIPVARVDIAFHGPAMDENAEDKGYLLGIHPSKEGAKVIADAHRELGYEPTVP